MHRVAIAVTPGLPMFELAAACEVFGGSRQDFPVPWWYEVRLCAAQDGPVRTAEGLLFDGTAGLTELIEADTVIVPACASVQDEPPPELLAALRAAASRGARIASICTGAFTLAAAGLLDGRPAATHWMHAAELARRWPAVKVEPNVLYTDDGQILTSAGSAAGLDLCLHIVRRDHGTRIANALARRLVIPPHRDGGQAQYIEQPLPDGATAEPRALPGLGQGALELPLTVDDLARQATDEPADGPRRRRTTVTTRSSGCAPSGCAGPRTCWRTPMTPWTGSRRPVAWGRPRCCARTSPGSTASPRTSSAAHSGTTRPEPGLSGRQISGQAAERRATHSVQASAVADRVALALRGDQPGLAQCLQVGRDRGLGHREELGEVTGADLRLGRQSHQDSPAHRMRQRAEHIDLVNH